MAIRKDMAKAAEKAGRPEIAMAIRIGGKHIGRPLAKTLKKLF